MYNRNPAPAHMVHSFSEMRLWFLARGCRSEVREPIVLVSWRHLINPPVFRSTCFSCASYFGISAFFIQADSFLFKQADLFHLTFSAASSQPISSVNSLPSFLVPETSRKLTSTNESLIFSAAWTCFFMSFYASVLVKSQGTWMLRHLSFTK